MDLGIRGRRAIVCASSRGLGRACAEALAREGVHLTLNAREVGALEAAADAMRSAHHVEVGSIAGTLPYGVGRLLTTFEGDNDGTVAVSETRLDVAKDHLCMNVTHNTMLVSSNVADQVAAFLKRGEFLRDL